MILTDSRDLLQEPSLLPPLKERKKYVAKIQIEIKEGKMGSGYKTIRKLGNRPGEGWKRQEVIIQSYVELNLSPTEAANKLALHFSAISNTVEPLDPDSFHPALKLTMKEGQKPVLSQHEVYRHTMKVRKPNSAVSGDVPRPLMKKYPFLNAAPITKIFNKMINTGKWPRQWVNCHPVKTTSAVYQKLPGSLNCARIC